MPATDALLFISSHCPHCPAMLQSLGELVKAGQLGRLDIYNIEQHPEQAIALGVRAVPWVKIGPFELPGLRTQGELLQWIGRVGDDSSMGAYFGELMTGGELNKVGELIKKSPALFAMLLPLMADDDTGLSVRIGIGALMEDFADTDLLRHNLDTLGEYTRHANPRVRNDACHYLGLSRDPRAENFIRPLLTDADAEVRDVAAEALETIKTAHD
jgi:thiol-disulfide isomerase/thioredoxin